VVVAVGLEVAADKAQASYKAILQMYASLEWVAEIEWMENALEFI
jgi:hypothetical protein